MADLLPSVPGARRPYYSLLFTSELRMEMVQMEALLARLIHENLLAGVTGLLVFSEARFVQALEGERERVQALFERIKRDPRHCDVQLLAAQFSSARRFAECAAHYVGADAGLRRQFGARAMLGTPLLEFMVDLAREECG